MYLISLSFLFVLFIIFGYCTSFEDSLVMINSAEYGRKTKYAITGAVRQDKNR